MLWDILYIVIGLVVGLVIGFLMAYVVGVPKLGQISSVKRIIAVIVAILIMVGLYYYGVTL